jgi:hypothetical protein
MNSAPPSTWIAWIGKGRRHQIVQKRRRRAARRSTERAQHGAATDAINGGELASLDAGFRPQLHRVERDQLAPFGGLPLVLRHPRRRGPGGSLLPDLHAMRFAQQVLPSEAGQNPADYRGTEVHALGAEQAREFVLTGTRILLA